MLPVAQARAGDSGAWDALLQRFRLPLYIYIFQMVREEQASFDLVQDTMISAVRNIGSLQEDAKFPNWLYRIARQKCLQHWRKSNREEDALRELGDAELNGAEDPRRLLIRREQRAKFLELLEKLPAQQREVLVLHFIEEFPLEAIAEVAGAPVGTIKSRLHYAKKAFRALWEES